MRATVASRALHERLGQVVKALGDYPHQELKHMTNGTKKQATRLIKAECAVCTYTVRVTKKWLDGYGAPLCPNETCDDYRKPLGVET